MLLKQTHQRQVRNGATSGTEEEAGYSASPGFTAGSGLKQANDNGKHITEKFREQTPF
jgi:hypothetical protein